MADLGQHVRNPFGTAEATRKESKKTSRMILEQDRQQRFVVSMTGLQVFVSLKDRAHVAVSGIKGVKLERESGEIEIVRNAPDVATLYQPSQPTRDINLPRRSLRDCLIEDLRRLDSDDAFGALILAGFKN